MKRWTALIMLTLALAAAIHVALVAWFPSLLMMAAHRGILSRAGGANVVVHNPPTTAENNPIVNSSPDILYSACAFDLSNGPVRFIAAVPGSYWSVSGYDSETNNFFSLNNEEAGARNIDLVLTGPEASALPGGRMVRSPSVRGVVLFRTLVPSRGLMNEMIGIQKQARCLQIGTTEP
ncbi:MAG: DUF1254 domain-containing protein [Spirochaetes bacterium]|nr:DUF1254 domain-containing protein [Spirochaetota bacterium]